MSRKFDAIVIGAGQAGPPLAERLTKEGLHTAIIERNLFGGTCVNVGCIPTKTLVGSARVAHLGPPRGGFRRVDRSGRGGYAAREGAHERGSRGFEQGRQWLACRNGES